VKKPKPRRIAAKPVQLINNVQELPLPKALNPTPFSFDKIYPQQII